jgi:hypothetical protein
MKFAAIYSIVVGAGMIGWWTFLLASGQVPEVETEPVRLAFHLVGEFVTGLLLVVGGVLLVRGLRLGPQLTLVALGILLYTVIASPGYYGQLGECAMVGMFMALLVLAVVSTVAIMCVASRQSPQP